MRRNVEAPRRPTSPETIMSRSARSSFRALSNCIRVISSGASSVARSAVSAASSAVNRDFESPHDQVIWAGFDKLEKEDGHSRVLLLAFKSGFQVWDVEETENVHVISSSHDGQAFFMQMLPIPIISAVSNDKFSESRPLLAVCGDSSWEENSRTSENPETEAVVPTNVYIYSLKSQSLVHTLRFRHMIYTVRCSSRVVAVLQDAQIHCFDATTLVMEHKIVINPIAYSPLGVGYGPLAVGPRWIAYSGTRIVNSSSSLVTTELLSPSSSPTVAQFARESSKQLASGIINLGDKGYKSFSRYCSEVLPNPYIPGLKGIGVNNENVPDADSVGMVIIKDIISKSVIAQFKAHKSPISALCFDPSGMLLVSASIQGHNINVFRINPRISTSSGMNTTRSSVHLFRLQRGFTNAVIQDISFSNDSNLIVIGSSRGTSHLFEIDPNQEVKAPLPLSAINRIRSGNNSSGWIGTMSNAAGVAAGMVGGSLSGATASTFCYSDEQKNTNYYGPFDTRNLLVFAPSGCMTQYEIKANQVGTGHETAAMTRFDFESGLETEGKVAVEPIRRWSMIENQSRREMEDRRSDIYGGGTAVESKSKVFPEIVRKQSVMESPVEDKHELYISKAELRVHKPARQPFWAGLKFRFQELVWSSGSGGGGGGGEIEIEGMETRTVEARRRDLVPVWGIIHSQNSQQVMKEPLQSPRHIGEGDHQVTQLGGGVHSKEEVE